MRAKVRDAVAAAIGERGPQTAEELGQALATAGLTRAKDPTRAVTGAMAWDRRFPQLADGRYVDADPVLLSAVLSHRLTDEEIMRDALILDADLGAFRALAARGLSTHDATGGTMHLLLDGEDRWHSRVGQMLIGPMGWLDGYRTGDVIEVRLEAGSVIAIERARVIEQASSAGDCLVSVAERLLAAAERGSGQVASSAVSVEAVLIEALVACPDLFATAVQPLGDIFQRKGFETRADLIGRSGIDWRSWVAVDDDPFDDDRFDHADDPRADDAPDRSHQDVAAPFAGGAEWYLSTMRTTIDAAGRIVVPKSLRAALGLVGGQEVEIIARDGRLEIEVAPTQMELEQRGGMLVAVPKRPLPPLTADQVRESLEHVRR